LRLNVLIGKILRPFKFDVQSTDRSGKCSGVFRKQIFFAFLLALAYPRFDSPCQISLRPVQSVAPAGRKAEKSALRHFTQRWR